MTFVGRKTQATAASSKLARSLLLVSVKLQESQILTDVTHRFSRLDVLGPLAFTPLETLASNASSHGHKYNAIMVRVVSKQFDRVRVEQNHCHGLHTVSASCEDIERQTSAWSEKT